MLTENVQQSLTALAINGTVIKKLTALMVKKSLKAQLLTFYCSINGVTGETNFVNCLETQKTTFKKH